MYIVVACSHCGYIQYLRTCTILHVQVRAYVLAVKMYVCGRTSNSLLDCASSLTGRLICCTVCVRREGGEGEGGGREGEQGGGRNRKEGGNRSL